MKNQNFPIVNATLCLTERCNLSCSYCFCGEKSTKVMTLDTAKKCVDFLIKNAVEADIKDLNKQRRSISVQFWGGEPLLEWKLLKDIVTYTESVIPKDVSVEFGGTTNGVLLTPDKFDYLDEHKIFFMISLDGTPETHDKYRVMVNGKGSHKYIINNAMAAIKRWPFYKVRISPYPERIDHFYDDIKYLIDHGMYNIMFSPVYEHDWTDKHWEIWKYQCFKVVDMIKEYRDKGIKIEIEHFKSYCRGDNSSWACGAGRFYCGFSTSGSIWPCHRYEKFSDQRPWQEQEMCIGHVDYGITNQELRQKFIDPAPICDCKYASITPCHNGCTGVNYDLTGKINTPHPGICKYVAMQHEVSMYLKEKVPESIPNNTPKSPSCICYNMEYLDNDKWVVGGVDNSNSKCHCNNATYTGDPDSSKVTREIKKININPYDLLKRIESLERDVKILKGDKS